MSLEWNHTYRKKFTAAEDDLIRKHYPLMGSKIVKLMPWRTVHSIQARASRLEVFVTDNGGRERRSEAMKEYYANRTQSVPVALDDFEEGTRAYYARQNNRFCEAMEAAGYKKTSAKPGGSGLAEMPASPVSLGGKQ